MADLQDELQATAEAGELDASPTTRTNTTRTKRKPKPGPGPGPTTAEPIAHPDDRPSAPEPRPDDRPSAHEPRPGHRSSGPEPQFGDRPSAPEPHPTPATLSKPAPASAPASEPEPADAPDVLEVAHAFLAGHPVADGYSGLPWVLRHLPWYDLELGEGGVDTDVPRMRKGHIGALFWSLHLPDGLTGAQAVGATLDQLDLVDKVVHAHPEGLRLVRGAGETTDARNCGRVAILLGPAGGPAIGDSLGILRTLHKLGLKALTLAEVSWAGEDGLTRFGEEVVREMNRVGVLADLSGATERTIRRTLSVSRAPVLCTRSAAAALRPHPVNLSDDLLAALGEARGLCMVPLTAEQTGPSIQDVADHLDHIRKIAGPECVGLSGTYDSGAAHPRDLTDASCYPRLVAELMERGWSEADLSLLTWDNVQRVLRMADFTARAAQDRREASRARITELDG
ncbi:membrane dipeptidase [Streptomyces sp. NPDC002643]